MGGGGEAGDYVDVRILAVTLHYNLGETGQKTHRVSRHYLLKPHVNLE